MMVWFLLLCMALITFCNRYFFFADLVRYAPGAKLRRFLSYSSFSVLTAIWAPIMFRFDANAELQIAGMDYVLGASIAAILSFFRVPSLFVVLLSVMAFYLVRLY